MIDADLSILEALADNPSLSQRQLARRAGVPLSKAHFVLRRLMDRGLVKLRNAKNSRHRLGYLYVLTPKGLEAKARLTYRFLERAAADYQRIREIVESALSAALSGASGAPVPVSILGDGSLREVVRHVVSGRGDVVLVSTDIDAEIAIVVDPGVRQDDRPGRTYVRLA